MCSRERISQAQRIHSVFIKILPSCWWLMIDLEFREDARADIRERARGRGWSFGAILVPMVDQGQGLGLILEHTL